MKNLHISCSTASNTIFIQERLFDVCFLLRNLNLCLLVFLGAGVSCGVARARTIDSDTILNSEITADPGFEAIEVINGLRPPTVVDVIEPAMIFHGLNVRGQSQLRFIGGTLGNAIEAFDDSRVLISGGSVAFGEDLEAHDDATITILGGMIGNGSDQLIADGHATISIRGGNIRKLVWAREYGTIELFGSNLVLTKVGSSPEDFVVTGMLSDGTSLNNAVFIQDQGRVVLANVPEPSTLAGFALGCILCGSLTTRRRR